MKQLAISLAAAIAVALPASAARQIVVVTGAGGEAAYTTEFRKQAAAWRNAAESEDFEVIPVTDEEEPTLAALQRMLAELPRDGDDLWIVLLGHGTFDGRNAKFNLVGDDLAASDLGKWLEPFTRRIVVLALFSASGAFVPELSGSNRMVLAATRSGGERNYARLGEKLPESLVSEDADLDGDGRISLLELALHATDAVARLYEDDQRVLTEHAILDDNGDGLGTEVRQLRKPTPYTRDGREASDVTFAAGNLAPAFTPEELAERERIESAMAALREEKPDQEEDTYYEKLEKLLLEMAALYETARKRE